MTASATTGTTVHTTTGQRLKLGVAIGQGGQGAVYAVEGRPDLCVKVYKGLSPDRAAQLRARLQALGALPETETLVLPRAVLESPDLGYVMDRVKDMAPLASLAVARREQDIREFYAETGGLRGRLIVGVHLAWAFQDLHSRGLAYCDLSFDNVMVGRSAGHRVRMIDCDNLTLEGSPPPAIEGTAWFIAPEVLKGTHRPDATTDAWSLAVLLYHLLVLTHPLLGDRVRGGPPEGEDAALAGRRPDGSLLPWIDHPDDRSNSTRLGLPRELVLSSVLRERFHTAFTAGVVDRHARLTEGRWADALLRAADATVLCGECGNSSYLGPATKPCPWCKATVAPPAVLVQHSSEGRRPIVVQRRRRLYPRHLYFRQGTPYERPEIDLTRRPEGLEVHASGAASLQVFRQDGSVSALSEGESALLRQGDGLQVAGHHPRVEVLRA